MMIILAFAIALGFMSAKKENMLLNINRNTELYHIVADGEKIRVQNAYTFLIQNTDNKAHSYTFSLSDPRIEFVRPKNEIKLEAGAKRKIVVILETKERLIEESMHDTPMDITITAVASDEPERVRVERHTRFVYPKMSEIEKAMKK